MVKIAVMLILIFNSKTGRENFICGMRIYINLLSTEKRFSKGLGLLLTRILESVNKYNFKQR